MKSFIRLGLLIFVSAAIVGCGEKSEAEKGYDEAVDLVDQQSALSAELEQKGHPSGDWSEAELQKYIANLDRLSALEDQLESNQYVAIENDGFVVAISKLRTAAEFVLQQKQSSEVSPENRAQYEKLSASLYEAMGVMLHFAPDSTSSVESMEQAIVFGKQKLEDIHQAQELVIAINPSLGEAAEDDLKNLAEYEELLKSYIKMTQGLLNERSQVRL